MHRAACRAALIFVPFLLFLVLQMRPLVHPTRSFYSVATMGIKTGLISNTALRCPNHVPRMHLHFPSNCCSREVTGLHAGTGCCIETCEFYSVLPRDSLAKSQTEPEFNTIKHAVDGRDSDSDRVPYPKTPLASRW